MIANDSISKDEVRDIYRKRAKRYDFTANLYYLIGFREWSYRRRAAAAKERSRATSAKTRASSSGSAAALDPIIPFSA